MNNNVFTKAMSQKILVPPRQQPKHQKHRKNTTSTMMTYAAAPLEFLIESYKTQKLKITNDNDNDDSEDDDEDDNKESKSDDEDEEDEEQTRHKIASFFYEQKLNTEMDNSKILTQIDYIKGPLKYDILTKGSKLFIIFDDGIHEQRNKKIGFAKIKYCSEHKNAFAIDQLVLAIADYIQNSKTNTCVDLFLEADAEDYLGSNARGSLLDVTDSLHEFTSRLVREPLRPEAVRKNLRIHAISRRHSATRWLPDFRNDDGTSFWDGLGTTPLPDEYPQNILWYIIHYQTFPDWIFNGLNAEPRLKKQGTEQLKFQNKIVYKFLNKVTDNTDRILDGIESFYADIDNELRSDDAQMVARDLRDSITGDKYSSDDGDDSKDAKQEETISTRRKTTFLSPRLARVILRIIDNPQVFLKVWNNICDEFALESSTGHLWPLKPMHPALALAFLYAACVSGCFRARIFIAMYTTHLFEYPRTFFMDPYAFNRMTRSYRPKENKKSFCSNSPEVSIGIVYAGSGHSGSYLNWFLENGYEILSHPEFEAKQYTPAALRPSTPCSKDKDHHLCDISVAEQKLLEYRNSDNERCIPFKRARNILIDHIHKYWTLPKPSFVKVVTEIDDNDENDDDDDDYDDDKNNYSNIYHRPSIAKILDLDQRTQTWFFDQIVGSLLQDGWKIRKDIMVMSRPAESNNDDDDDDDDDEKYLLIFQTADSQNNIIWNFDGGLVKDLKLTGDGSGWIHIVLRLIRQK